MATIPAASYISNSARTQGEVKQGLEDTIASLRQVPGAAQVELSNTILSGSITPAGSGGVLVIDTEASAATDDLTNIVTTNYPDGACLLIRNNNNTRFVVCKQAAGGGGQLQLDRSADYVLDDTKKWLLIQRRGADWYEIVRGPVRMTTLTVAKSATFTIQKEDLGKTFLCTGTYTVAAVAAAGLGNGFLVTLRNVSTGTLTFDPNSSELIDGATTLAILPGSSMMLACDGAAWSSVAAKIPQEPAVNPIINGTMEVWQRGTAFAAITSGAYAADRWRWGAVGAGVVTINRSTNVPTVAQAGVLFNYSLEVDVTTADASIAAGDFYVVSQRIEGYHWRHFAQRQLTLSFWAMSPKTGTHCVACRNNATATPDRCYIGTYTINAADTWEYKTVTLSASPSAGTWDYTTGAGLEVAFALAAGSTFQTTAGAWQTGNFYGTSAQVNVMDSTANFFRLTGVKLELGPVATPLAPSSFADELARCQRYYQKSFSYASEPVQNVGTVSGAAQTRSPVGATVSMGIPLPFKTLFRGLPTLTSYNPSAANAQVRNVSNGTDSTGIVFDAGGESATDIAFVTSGTTTVGHHVAVHWTADAEL